MKQTPYLSIIQREIAQVLDRVEPEQTEALLELLLGAPTVFCDGLGRSALAMRGFAMRLGQLGRPSVLVGETTAPSFQPGDVLMVCSASGTSPVLCYHARQAVEHGGAVALLTGAPQSPLADLASAAVILPAPHKDEGRSASCQPMGSLFEQCALLLCDSLTLSLMDRLAVTAEDMRRRHANIE